MRRLSERGKPQSFERRPGGSRRPTISFLPGLLSWAIEPLALSFRPVELAALAGSVLVVGAFFVDRTSSRRDGAALILLYVCVAAAFFISGDR